MTPPNTPTPTVAAQNNARSAPPIPLDLALQHLLQATQPLLEFEQLPTLQADRRVLARDVVSALAVPQHDNSAMDGYAVRAAEFQPDAKALPVSQRIAAGHAALALQPGTVARIFTGATVPAGADAVVPQEQVETVAGSSSSSSLVKPTATVDAGQWIRRAGEDVALGQVVLRSGCRLGPAELGLAAGVGMDRLWVRRRPRVALFSTGDELVMPGEVLPQDMAPGAIYNASRFFLNTLLQRLGCEVSDLGIVPDRRADTEAVLQQAAVAHDLILTSGGVSVGEEDHVKPAVQALGSLDLWQIAIKPGKPFAWGQVGAARFIGLPGNPVSSFVTFLMLVRPYLLRLQGVQHLEPAAQTLVAGFDWPRPDRRREFLRVRLGEDGRLALFANQSSGVLTSMTWADGLLDNPPGQVIRPGDPVRFIAMHELLN